MAQKEEEKDKGFKVEDRRRFSPEGEVKPEFRGQEERPAAAAQAAHAETKAEESTGSAAAFGAAQPAAGGAYEEITFASFVVGLSTEALALLGEMPHPTTGERTYDLKGAQQIIDILGVLREKTRGNLSPDEEGLIDAILFDLRMKYVEIARQPR